MKKQTNEQKALVLDNVGLISYCHRTATFGRWAVTVMTSAVRDEDARV